MRRRLPYVVLVTVLAAATIASSQDDEAVAPEQSVRRVADQLGVFMDHLDVTVTNLYVTVTDKEGRPVIGLRPGEFVSRLMNLDSCRH